MAIDKNELVEVISSLTLMEAADLVKALEDKLGIQASAPMAMMAMPAAGAAEVKEEKTTFDVELTEIGPEKIQVIKVVRELTGLGLKEAKDLVESAPKMVKEGLDKAEADKIKAKFDEVKAKATIK